MASLYWFAFFCAKLRLANVLISLNFSMFKKNNHTNHNKAPSIAERAGER